MKDLTPHELIQDCYPIAAQCISSLIEIAKVNPNLLQEVLELAIVIGISSAHQRIEWDKKKSLVEDLHKVLKLGPSWDIGVPKGY